MNAPRRSVRILILMFAFAASARGRAMAQSPAGPTNLPAPPDVVRLPNRPAPEAAPVPPEQVMIRVGQSEDAAAAALGAFTYRKVVRLEEFGPDGKASGRAESVSMMTVEPDGSRRSRPGPRTESTLRSTELEPDVLETISRIPIFPFGSAQLPQYDFAFQASEKVDDLMTYVFKVTPRHLSRTAAYFSGVIWVDDRDFAVVKSYGKWVTETGDVKLGELPFNFFETYSQYVAGKYWMPAYLRSDGYLGSGSARTPVRLTVRWEEFKLIPGAALPQPGAVPPPAQPPPASAGSAPSPAKPAPSDSDRPTLAPRNPR